MDKKKIIIVDDQPENLQILLEILKEDYAVIATTSAQKSLELANTQPKACAILMDIYMPEMNGFEACSLLKNNPDTKDIPLLFISGSSSEQEYQQGFEVGAYDFVSKPVSATLLKHRIKQAIA